MVPLESALGQHDEAQWQLVFACDSQRIVHQTGHLDLLPSPLVAEQLLAWLGRRPTERLSKRPTQRGPNFFHTKATRRKFTRHKANEIKQFTKLESPDRMNPAIPGQSLTRFAQQRSINLPTMDNLF